MRKSNPPFSNREKTVIKENYGLPFDFYSHLLNNRTNSSVKTEWSKMDSDNVIKTRTDFYLTLRKHPNLNGMKTKELVALITSAGLSLDPSTLHKTKDNKPYYSIKTLNMLIYSINKFINGDLYVSDEVLEDFIEVMETMSKEYTLQAIEEINGMTKNTLSNAITKQSGLLVSDAAKLSTWLGTLKTKPVSNDLFTHADENETLSKLNEFVDSFTKSINEVKELKQTIITHNMMHQKSEKLNKELTCGITELESQNEYLNKLVEELKAELIVERAKVSLLEAHNKRELVTAGDSSDDSSDTRGFFKKFLHKK